MTDASRDVNDDTAALQHVSLDEGGELGEGLLQHVIYNHCIKKSGLFAVRHFTRRIFETQLYGVFAVGCPAPQSLLKDFQRGWSDENV